MKTHDVCRFAPSATGRAHPGTLLAALLCWLDARSRAAHLVLRLEDLDPERCRSEFTAGIQHDLAWFGLDWDTLEIQSDHAPRHHAALDALSGAAGCLYPCSLSRTELRAIGRQGSDGTWLSDNRHRGTPLPAGGWRACSEPLRTRVPDHLGDPVVRRRDGAIAYQLAVVVDDAAVGVTRIVRGRDLAASTPTQVALQELLGLPTPTYHHHTLLLEPNGVGKLSKFHAAVAVPEMQAALSPEALCGILAHALGLRHEATPLRPHALVDSFTWNAVGTADIAVHWTGSTLKILTPPIHVRSPAVDPRAYTWLTPPAPGAIAIASMPALAAAFDRPLPPRDRARFMRLVRPDGTQVDELMVDRVADDRLYLMPHGGPGVRQAVDACLAAHGLTMTLGPAGGPHEAKEQPLWHTLAHAPSPAAAAWILANPGVTPPFAADFLHRTPLVLITGPANAGKSTLLNHWCGHRRALVSDIPGTTRDLVAAETLIDGWRVRLLDSAGLRATDDPLEQAGQALVAAARLRADMVLSLRPPYDDTPDCATDLVVLGKADLRAVSGSEAGHTGHTHLRWSTQDPRAGLANLGRAVCERLGLPAGPTG